MMLKKDIENYCKQIIEIPDFLEKYLNLENLKRLQKIDYFCGMTHASKGVYDFAFSVSRFDHSLSTALLTWRFTKRKKDTLAALFHDIATPCFSHVIDYMNKDYQNQESTEEKTEEILKSDLKLREMLKQDDLQIEDIIEFKKYSIVDNDRPKLCADRIDGILLTSMACTKKIKLEETSPIIDNITIFSNEEDEIELGFKNEEIVRKVMELNYHIDQFFHSNADNYMMELLGKLTKIILNKKVINYDELFSLNEDELIDIFKKYAKKDSKFEYDFILFQTILKKDVPIIKLPFIKRRWINPLLNGQRFLKGKKNT